MNISLMKKLLFYVEICLAAACVTVIIIGVTMPLQKVNALAAASNEKAETEQTDKQVEEGAGFKEFKNLLETDKTRSVKEKKPEKPTRIVTPEKRKQEHIKNELKNFVKLNGICVEKDAPEESVALVSWEKGKDVSQGVYSPGDVIKDSEGTVITRIEYDRINVKRDDVEVSIPHSPGSASTSSTNRVNRSRTASTSAPARRDPRRRTPNERSQLNVKRYGRNKYQLDREEIEPYLNNPAQLFTEMKIEAQKKGGQATGNFIVKGMKQDALLKKVGLREGDVIMRINGQNPAQVHNVINDPSINEINVEYIRGGRRQTLHYTIR